MPFFKWMGIDEAGIYKNGIQQARSFQEMARMLANHNIALINHITVIPKGARSFKLKQKLHFFRQLSSLLNSGIYIDQALEIVALQERSPTRKDFLMDIFLQVQDGAAFSTVLEQYPLTFDHLTIQTISAGQHSGLVHALQVLSDYFQQEYTFRSQVRQALMMPLITTFFFAIITLVIFLGIMPTFAALFDSFNQPLPPLTAYLLAISQFLANKKTLLISGCIGAVFLVSWRWFYKEQLQKLFLWQLPFSSTIRDIYLCRFFQSLHILLASGTPMKIALETINHTVANPLTERIGKTINRVLVGTSLSDALASDPLLFSDDVRAYVRIGQETGNLPTLIARIVLNYQDRIQQKLTFYGTIIQPTVLIVLGLWIALLIIGVYMPIFNLSHAIH